MGSTRLSSTGGDGQHTLLLSKGGDGLHTAVQYRRSWDTHCAAVSHKENEVGTAIYKREIFESANWSEDGFVRWHSAETGVRKPRWSYYIKRKKRISKSTIPRFCATAHVAPTGGCLSFSRRKRDRWDQKTSGGGRKRKLRGRWPWSCSFF